MTELYYGFGIPTGELSNYMGDLSICRRENVSNPTTAARGY